jgi:hypothetical protein
MKVRQFRCQCLVSDKITLYIPVLGELFLLTKIIKSRQTIETIGFTVKNDNKMLHPFWDKKLLLKVQSNPITPTKIVVVLTGGRCSDVKA